MADIKFLDKFKKELEDIEGITTESTPPRYSYNTGNYVLNKITSGSFYKGGIAVQGRVGNLAGPSGSGKSFLLCNIIREAQQAGAHILVIDSEHALDDKFVQAIGVDTSTNYTYIGVTTIPQVTNVVSQFIKGYKAECGTSKDAPQVLIAIDSLDMLITTTELEHYDKGDQKGDQGQRAKTLKHMLRTFVQDIKPLNISIVTTSQVYKNQDPFAQEPWVVNDAVRYASSIITLLTKLRLKETGSADVKGIKMKCECIKVRYTKPFQNVVISVPYESGMDKFSGLLETGISMNIIEKAGSRYKISGSEETWYSKDIEKYSDQILSLGEAQSHAFLVVNTDLLDITNDEKSSKQRREEKSIK